MRRADFERLLDFADTLGPSSIEAISDAIFEYDEFPPYTGCPDLLVWTKKTERPFWFFAEVKSLNDHLQQTQIDWLRRNWELIQGRFVIVNVC